MAKGFIFFYAIKLDTITSSLGYLAFGNLDFLFFFAEEVKRLGVTQFNNIFFLD